MSSTPGAGGNSSTKPSGGGSTRASPSSSAFSRAAIRPTSTPSTRAIGPCPSSNFPGETRKLRLVRVADRRASAAAANEGLPALAAGVTAGWLILVGGFAFLRGGGRRRPGADPPVGRAPRAGGLLRRRRGFGVLPGERGGRAGRAFPRGRHPWPPRRPPATSGRTAPSPPSSTRRWTSCSRSTPPGWAITTGRRSPSGRRSCPSGSPSGRETWSR